VIGLYTERPSINTRTLSADESLKPRMLMAQVLVLDETSSEIAEKPSESTFTEVRGAGLLRRL
jgi:hypothetical protein